MEDLIFFYYVNINFNSGLLGFPDKGSLTESQPQPTPVWCYTRGSLREGEGNGIGSTKIIDVYFSWTTTVT